MTAMAPDHGSGGAGSGWARRMAGLCGALGIPLPGAAREHPLLRANRDAFARVDHDIPLSECSFTVLDTELTGLDPRGDEIVSLGAVRLAGLSIRTQETFYCVVRPRRELPKASTLIHRLTPSQVREAAPLPEVLPGFVEFLGTSLIIGHNVGLDMGFLNRACLSLMGGRLRNPCLDTMHMARILRAQNWENLYDRYDLRVSYSLADLAAEHGLPRFPAHNALTDALQTAYLFVFLVRKLSGGGITTLRQLFEAGRAWRWYF
ncbi:Exonuclease RNase T and DNA polymerase III [Desulfovibrio sp. X2]|uniref:3'-5' exonuclease n=1 Tax=Desulfovibrio sp. X2 TaxID=941449 RepID=UPI0003589BE4|nr:3'-5' exonuclease [Desulfovibrio sp. X2]EPR37068.1 Exonuclease RNase T and DNA polymerase III [Desulfovibrio sp. X2]